MRQSIQFNEPAEPGARDVGSIVIRDRGRPAVFRVSAARNDARCDGASNGAFETMPRARHTLSRTPHGYVATTQAATFDWATSYARYQEARARRAAALDVLVREVIRSAGGFLRRAWARHRRRRDTRAIFHALSGLDDRTLRDLGFHRCEILSVAAETTGEAEPTRVRTALSPRAPS